MDTPALAPSFLAAGKEYVEKLSSLGMDIEVACWAFDAAVDGFVLMIVTDFFDVRGPLEISKVLFKAYNSSVTPRSIDPFSVRLQSTNHPFSREIRTWAPGTWVQQVDKATGKPFGARTSVKGGTVGEVTFNVEWLIKASAPVARKDIDISRRWKRFVANVDKAAA